MEVHCHYSPPLDNGYICYIKNVTICSAETEIIKVNGEHRAGETNLDVNFIWIFDSTLKFFPRGLDKIFPNAIHLKLLNCGLKSISREDLKGFENLEELNLDNNELTSLPSDLFQDMKKLKKISFDNNKLEAMSSNLLKPIKGKLKRASFRGNTKINAFFSSEVPGPMTLAKLIKLIDTNCDAQADKFPNGYFKVKISAGLEDLWESRRFSDFTIITGSKEFAVHKNVLGIQSSVFAAIIESDMKKRNEGKMEIKDFSAAAVEDFLRCLYTGEIQNDNNAMELFALAAKYDVPDLKSIAEEKVLRNVDDKNAMEILCLGNIYGSEELKKKAFKEIQKMFPEVTLSAELKDKPEDVAKLIEGKQILKRKIQEIEKGFEEQQVKEKRNCAKKIKQAEEKSKKKKKAAKKEFHLMLEKWNDE